MMITADTTANVMTVAEQHAARDAQYNARLADLQARALAYMEFLLTASEEEVTSAAARVRKSAASLVLRLKPRVIEATAPDIAAEPPPRQAPPARPASAPVSAPAPAPAAAENIASSAEREAPVAGAVQRSHRSPRVPAPGDTAPARPDRFVEQRSATPPERHPLAPDVEEICAPRRSGRV